MTNRCVVYMRVSGGRTKAAYRLGMIGDRFASIGQVPGWTMPVGWTIS